MSADAWNRYSLQSSTYGSGCRNSSGNHRAVADSHGASRHTNVTLSSAASSDRSGLLNACGSTEMETWRFNAFREAVGSEWFASSGSSCNSRSLRACATSANNENAQFPAVKSEPVVYPTSSMMEWDCTTSSHELCQQLKQQPSCDDFDSMCDLLIDNLETGALASSSCAAPASSHQRQAALFPVAIDDEKLMSMLVDFRTDDDNCFASSLANDGKQEDVDSLELTTLALGSGIFDTGLEALGFPSATDYAQPLSAIGSDANVQCSAIDRFSATVDHDYCTHPWTDHEALITDTLTGKTETSSVSGCDAHASRRSSVSSLSSSSSSSTRCDALRQLLLDNNLADEVRRQAEIDREASRLKMSTRTSAADAASEFIARLWKMKLARELQQQLQQQQQRQRQALDHTASFRHCGSAEVQSLSSSCSDHFSASPDVAVGSPSHGLIDLTSALQNAAAGAWPSLCSSPGEHVQTLTEAELSNSHAMFTTTPSSDEPDDASVEDIGGEETIATTTVTSTSDDENCGIEQYDAEFDDPLALNDRPEMLLDLPSCGAVASSNVVNNGYLLAPTTWSPDEDNDFIPINGDDEDVRTLDESDAATDSAPETNAFDEVDDEIVVGLVTNSEEVERTNEVRGCSAAAAMQHCNQDEDGKVTSADGEFPADVTSLCNEYDDSEGVHVTAMISAADGVESSHVVSSVTSSSGTVNSRRSAIGGATAASVGHRLQLIGRPRIGRLAQPVAAQSLTSRFRWNCRRSSAFAKPDAVGRRFLMAALTSSRRPFVRS